MSKIGFGEAIMREIVSKEFHDFMEVVKNRAEPIIVEVVNSDFVYVFSEDRYEFTLATLIYRKEVAINIPGKCIRALVKSEPMSAPTLKKWTQKAFDIIDHAINQRGDFA